MIRAFLALPLPPQVQERMEEVQSLLPLPRHSACEDMHLTLPFLGEQSEPILEELHHSIAALSLPRLTLAFAGLGLAGGARPTAAQARIAPNPALEHLHRKLTTAAHRAGIATESRRLRPHITLARFAPPVPDDRIRLERAIAGGAGLGAEPFIATAVALYRSTLGKHGARYDILADYPLT